MKYDALYTPGPGKYNYLKDIGEDKNKISMSARLNTPDSNYYKVSPNQYKPLFNQTEKEIVKKFTFGYGRKL